MKISLVTPAGKQSRAGNRTTAVRWARILQDLGHRVEISEASDGDGADIMIAIHAWRSAKSIQAFSEQHPNKPLIVLLAGTDIYSFQRSHPEDTIASMDRATRLVCLHDLVHRAIPKKFGKKLRIIRQSSAPLTTPRQPSKHWFEVCVAGHLREEKDSLRTAYAARLAPPESNLRVVHLGKAHEDIWARNARAEMAENHRFVWRGEVPGWKVRRQFARSHAMVISSIMEGGANIVSEAIVCGVPVIASDIDGNIGLLGADYEGYYAAKDEAALASLLLRAENEPAFLKTLARQCRAKKALFTQAKEKAAWKALLKEIGN